MKIFFCLCSLLYSLLSLAQNKPFIVDLEKSNEDVSLNILFDKIEYVPLETTPECFLKPGAYYYVTDKYIVAMNTFGKLIYLIEKQESLLEDWIVKVVVQMNIVVGLFI